MPIGLSRSQLIQAASCRPFRSELRLWDWQLAPTLAQLSAPSLSRSSWSVVSPMGSPTGSRMWRYSLQSPTLADHRGTRSQELGAAQRRKHRVRHCTIDDDPFSVCGSGGLDWRVVSSSLTVRSDPRLLEQIMRNLLSNAVKYTTEGKLLLGCRRCEDKLRIEVWDTGTSASRSWSFRPSSKNSISSTIPHGNEARALV